MICFLLYLTCVQETLIKTQADEEFDEEEVTNDEEMNKMLARNDEELVIFNQMDKDRYETDRRIYPHFKENTSYRLLQAHEVPEWVQAEESRSMIFLSS